MPADIPHIAELPEVSPESGIAQSFLAIFRPRWAWPQPGSALTPTATFSDGC